jgi:hypothetical protein
VIRSFYLITVQLFISVALDFGVHETGLGGRVDFGLGGITDHGVLGEEGSLSSAFPLSRFQHKRLGSFPCWLVVLISLSWNLKAESHELSWIFRQYHLSWDWV